MCPAMVARIFVLVFAVTLYGCRNNSIQGPRTPAVLQAGEAQDTDVKTEIVDYYKHSCVPGYAGPSSLLAPSKKAKSHSTESKSKQTDTNNPSRLDTGPGSGNPGDVGPPNSVITSLDICRVLRNSIIYDLKNIIDNNYESYARHFQQTADTATFAGEVSGATLSAVSTIVGAGDLKDILSTASTLAQSTNASVQKNFYQKQTEYSILAQMDSDRSTQWSAIIQKMIEKDVGAYPLGAAFNDLLEYKRAGTAVAALTSITQRAGAQISQSKDLINDKTGVTSPEQNKAEKENRVKQQNETNK